MFFVVNFAHSFIHICFIFRYCLLLMLEVHVKEAGLRAINKEMLAPASL